MTYLTLLNKRSPFRTVSLLLVALLLLAALAMTRLERSVEATTTPLAVDSSVASVRILPLPANDLAYNPQSGKLYASIPSALIVDRVKDPVTFRTTDAVNTIGSRGNSITTINPATLTVENSLFVGSEPGKLALSDDFQRLYVNLTGSRTIRWLDLTTYTLGSQFWLGEQSYIDENNAVNGALHKISDMRVLPARHGSLALTWGQVAVYDDGVRRLNTTDIYSGIELLVPASSSILYGVNNIGDLMTLAVNDAGVSESSRVRNFDLLNGPIYDMKYDDGLLYTAKGQIVDPRASRLVGHFPGFRGDDYPTTALVVTDPLLDLVYYLVVTSPSAEDSVDSEPVSVKVFNKRTLALIGSFDIPHVYGRPKGFTRWGANGLAFCSGNELYVMRTALIPSSESLELPPSPPPVPTSSPVFPLSTREINLPNNDIIYDRWRNKLYASVPAYAGASGNSVAVIEPLTGAISSSIRVGADPGKLAISDDGQYLYVGLNGEQAVRRINLATQMPDLQFPIGPVSYPPFGQFPQPVYAVDMQVPPGQPHSVAVARMYI